MYKIQIQLLLQEKRKKEEDSHVTIGQILDLILVLPTSSKRDLIHNPSLTILQDYLWEARSKRR